MLKRFGTYAAACFLAVQSANAQMQVGPLGDIYLSYNDCFAVAGENGFDPEVLETLGWSPSENHRESRDGEARVYGHSERAPQIILSDDGDVSFCAVTARLESVEAFDEFTDAWGGALPAPNADGVIFFRAEGRIVRLERTGSDAEPALSIAVFTPSESN